MASFEESKHSEKFDEEDKNEEYEEGNENYGEEKELDIASLTMLLASGSLDGRDPSLRKKSLADVTTLIVTDAVSRRELSQELGLKAGTYFFNF